MILHTYGSLPYGAGTYLGGTATLSLLATSFYAGLRELLANSLDLAELTEVYYRRTEPRPVYPFAIVTPITQATELTNTADYWQEEEVQVSVLATSDDEAEELGQAAYRVMAPFRRDGSGIAVPRERIRAYDAYEMGAIPGRNELVEQPGRVQGNRIAWAYHFQYTFLLGKSMAV